MKKLLIILLLFCGTLQAKDLGLEMTTFSNTSGTIPGRSKMVIFIFSSGFVGTIGTPPVAFTGTDGSLTLTTQGGGDTLVDIAYAVTSGNLRIARLQ